MILEIQHETQLKFSELVTEIDHRAADGAGQRCRPELPFLSPDDPPDCGTLPLPGRLRQPRSPFQPATAARPGDESSRPALSRLILHRATIRPPAGPPIRSMPSLSLEVLDFLRFGGPVRPVPAPGCRTSTPCGLESRLADLAMNVAHHIGEPFQICPRCDAGQLAHR